MTTNVKTMNLSIRYARDDDLVAIVEILNQAIQRRQYNEVSYITPLVADSGHGVSGHLSLVADQKPSLQG